MLGHLKLLTTWMDIVQACNKASIYWPFVMGICQLWLADSPHKAAVMWKVFPCHGAIMNKIPKTFTSMG